MVTAEAAVVLPTLLLVLGLGFSAVGHVVDVIRATDAARAGARAAARGDDDDAVLRAIQTQTGEPAGAASARITRGGAQIQVWVSVPGGPVLPGLSWSAARWPPAEAEAVAAAESSVTP
jgi:Flp pilus assembly protein TadG